jgi:hypothetical protein
MLLKSVNYNQKIVFVKFYANEKITSSISFINRQRNKIHINKYTVCALSGLRISNQLLFILF